jgi:GNAT superfamily N-acetyltransferase
MSTPLAIGAIAALATAAELSRRGSRSKLSESDMVLYRATTDPIARQGAHFTEYLEDAVAYTDNPGFGGPDVYSYRVSLRKALEVDNLEDLAEAYLDLLDDDQKWDWDFKLGEPPTAYGIFDYWKATGYTHVFHVLEGWERGVPVVEEVLGDKYDWISFPDDFPAGSTTWKYLGTGPLKPDSKKPLYSKRGSRAAGHASKGVGPIDLQDLPPGFRGTYQEEAEDSGIDLIVEVLNADKALVNNVDALYGPDGVDELDVPSELAKLGLRPDDPVLSLEFMEVPLKNRFKGRGMQEVQRIEEWAKRYGLKGIFLYSSKTQTFYPHSRPFWHHAGFTVPKLDLSIRLRGQDAIMFKPIGRGSRALSLEQILAMAEKAKKAAPRKQVDLHNSRVLKRVAGLDGGIALFSYGSNSVRQLSERLGHPLDETYGAYAPDHQRIFRGWSHGWGGGVASIEPKQGMTTYGYVAVVSPRDLRVLDRYEGVGIGAYERKLVDVVLRTGDGPKKQKALFYRATSKRFNAPSQSYKQAVAQNIRQFWRGSGGTVTAQDITVR